MSEKKTTLTKVKTTPEFKSLVQQLNDCRKLFDESPLSNAAVFEALAIKKLREELAEWKEMAAKKLQL